MSLSINLVPPQDRPYVRCRFNVEGEDAVTYDVIVSWWCFRDDSLDGRDDGDKFFRRVLVTAYSEDQARQFINCDYGYDSTRIESIAPLGSQGC